MVAGGADGMAKAGSGGANAVELNGRMLGGGSLFLCLDKDSIFALHATTMQENKKTSTRTAKSERPTLVNLQLRLSSSGNVSLVVFNNLSASICRRMSAAAARIRSIAAHADSQPGVHVVMLICTSASPLVLLTLLMEQHEPQLSATTLTGEDDDDDGKMNTFLTRPNTRLNTDLLTLSPDDASGVGVDASTPASSSAAATAVAN